jgi:hypothetical protein
MATTKRSYDLRLSIPVTDELASALTSAATASERTIAGYVRAALKSQLRLDGFSIPKGASLVERASEVAS